MKKKMKMPVLPTDTVPPEERTGGVGTIDPIIFPNLQKLYDRRLGRLSTFKEKALEEQIYYLEFLEAIVSRQKLFFENKELPTTLLKAINNLELSQTALTTDELSKLLELNDSFQKFIAPLLDKVPAVSKKLKELSAKDFVKEASLLLNGDFSEANNEFSILIWSFLSVCFAAARDLSKAQDFLPENKENEFSDNCPCCGSLSSGSILMTGAREGLRYRQCSLCEARWHKVRTMCTVCGKSGLLDYWLLDSETAPIEAESCGDCKTYSKVFRLDRDSDLEVVIDDLESIALDIKVEEKGFSRNTINPFSLPV